MKKIAKTDIGERLFEWMIDNPMNTEEIAKLIGISRNTVLSISRGVTEPRNKVRCKIEKFLKDYNAQLTVD